MAGNTEQSSSRKIGPVHSRRRLGPKTSTDSQKQVILSSTAKKGAPKKVDIDFGAPIPPTSKQLSFISDIEAYTHIPFMGTTKEAASEYISEHIENYYEARRFDDEDLEEWQIGSRDGFY